MIELSLPYPPTVNHYYRHTQRGVFLTPRAKKYRAEVYGARIEQLGVCPPLEGSLAIKVDLYPPDRIRRDIDNVLKGLFDSIQHAGIVQDDSQFTALLVQMFPKSDQPRAMVEITRVPHVH